MTTATNPDPHQLGPLLNRSVTGDARAFNDLMERLRPYLHCLVRRRLGPEDNVRLDHSSVVQKCLLRVSQRFAQLRQPDVPHFLRWVGLLVRNLITDELRAGANRPQPAHGSHLLAALSKGASPDGALERDERVVRLAAALERLPERQRQVVELRFFDGLADAEICQRLGGTEGAVRILRLRALRQLRTFLEPSPLGGDQ